MKTFDVTMQEYWTEKHQAKDVGALSGHSLADHLDFLRIQPKPTDLVLCIGVGTGDWVRELAAIQQKVPVCLDICLEALKNLWGLTDPKNLVDNWIDCALSLWVAPHMQLSDLRYQIKHVVRSLTDGGVFALQYNESQKGSTLMNTNAIGLARAGLSSITKGEFQEAVRDAGGIATIEHSQPTLLGYEMKVAHIRRAT